MAEDVDPRLSEDCQDGGSLVLMSHIEEPTASASPTQSSSSFSAPQSGNGSTHVTNGNEDLDVVASSRSCTSSPNHVVTSTEQPEIPHTGSGLVCGQDNLHSDFHLGLIEVGSNTLENYGNLANCSRAERVIECEQPCTLEETRKSVEPVEIDVDSISEGDNEVRLTHVEEAVQVSNSATSVSSITQAVAGIQRQNVSQSHQSSVTRHLSDVSATAATAAVAARSPSHTQANGQPIETGTGTGVGVIVGNAAKFSTIRSGRALSGDNVSPLPRPSNPGGLYDSRLSGLDLHQASGLNFFNMSRTCVGVTNSDLKAERTHPHRNLRNSPQGRPRSGATNRSFPIATTPVKWSSSINESVERPLPSSIVDSERVAKNNTRLNTSSLESDNHWYQRLSDNPNLSARTNRNRSRSPLERPRPPLRSLDLSLDSTRPTNRRHTLSPNGSPRNRVRLNYNHHTSSPSSAAYNRHSDGAITHQTHISTSLDEDKSSPDPLDQEDSFYSISPDEDQLHYPTRFYKCRFCSFSAATYTQLQHHMPKHGGQLKALKCPLCDYTTNDKSNFRRHRRLHAKSNPVSVLKCGKCSYTTILSRKIREHYHSVHNDSGLPGMTSELTDTTNYATQHYYGSARNGSGTIDIHHGNCSNTDTSACNTALPPVLINGNGNSSYLYPPSTGFQPTPSCMLGQYSEAYGANDADVRNRHSVESNMASDYLRSIVSSLMNSHHVPSTSSRPQVSSTVTSSNYFLPQPLAESTPTMLSEGQGCDLEVKVKLEPSDCGGEANLSTSIMPHNLTTGNTETFTSRQSSAFHNQSDMDQTNITANQHGASNSLSGGYTQPGSTSTEIFNGRQTSSEDSSLINVKTEMISVGIQCVLPIIKSELDLDGDSYAFEECEEVRHFPRCRCIDQAVQCDIHAPSPGIQSQQLLHRPNSISESDVSEHPSSLSGESRCSHCGICFEDEVMFSIHLGCHSHTDPFMCNVCGKQCGNKYGFYSHIMRGHQI